MSIRSLECQAVEKSALRLPAAQPPAMTPGGVQAASSVLFMQTHCKEVPATIASSAGTEVTNSMAVTAEILSMDKKATTCCWARKATTSCVAEWARIRSVAEPGRTHWTEAT